jgi:hypothetical protein
MLVFSTLLVLLATVSSQIARIERVYSDTIVPLTTNYSSTILLATPKNGEFTLSFTARNESLDLMIRATGPMDYAWFSIAFGNDMRNSDFIVLHQKPNGTQVHQHSGTGREYGMSS